MSLAVFSSCTVERFRQIYYLEAFLEKYESYLFTFQCNSPKSVDLTKNFGLAFSSRIEANRPCNFLTYAQWQRKKHPDTFTVDIKEGGTLAFFTAAYHLTKYSF